MDMLAKAFFDYQSFVNLPHKAVQLHKTPPSQAGVDPSAGWAPKSYHNAGRNQAAPQARANRNHMEHRPGGPRHGRPSKLEFRNWGDRHGELHMEKTVPHKDAWMASLDGDFKHFYEDDEDEELTELGIDPYYFSKMGEDAANPVEVLIILTLANQLEFLTVTVKVLRGISHTQDPSIKIKLFDGIQLMEERRSSGHATDGSHHRSSKLPSKLTEVRQSRVCGTSPTPKRTDLVSSPSLGYRVASATGRRPLRMAQTQHPHQYSYHSSALQHLRCNEILLPPATSNHNGFANRGHQSPRRSSSPKHAVKHIHWEDKPLSRRSSIGSTVTLGSIAKEEGEVADLSESFLMHVNQARLAQCHLLVQVFTKVKTLEDGNEENDQQEQVVKKEKEKDVMVGGCVIGPMSPGRGHLHWRQMIRKIGQPVCMWHHIVRSPPKTSEETAHVDKETEETEKEGTEEVQPVAPAPQLITEVIEEEQGSVES